MDESMIMPMLLHHQHCGSKQAESPRDDIDGEGMVATGGWGIQVEWTRKDNVGGWRLGSGGTTAKGEGGRERWLTNRGCGRTRWPRGWTSEARQRWKGPAGWRMDEWNWKRVDEDGWRWLRGRGVVVGAQERMVTVDWRSARRPTILLRISRHDEIFPSAGIRCVPAVAWVVGVFVFGGCCWVPWVA